ncbi:C40 family peptidase [Hutsoniella sourekii]
MKKSIFKTLFTSAMVVAAAAPSAQAFAQDYDAMIQDTELQIEGLSAQQANLYEELQNLYGQINILQEEANQVLAGLEADNNRLEELEAEIAKLEDIIAKRQEVLAKQARAVQTSTGSANYLNYVTASEGVSDFVGRVDVVRKMVDANRDLLNTQKDDKASVDAAKKETEATKQAKVEKMNELESLKGELSAHTADQEAVYNQLSNDINIAAANREALIQEKAAFIEAQRVAAAEAAAAQEAALKAEQEAIAAAQAQADAEAQALAQAQEAAAQAQAEADALVAVDPAVDAAASQAQAVAAEAQAQADAVAAQAPAEVAADAYYEEVTNAETGEVTSVLNEAAYAEAQAQAQAAQTAAAAEAQAQAQAAQAQAQEAAAQAQAQASQDQAAAQAAQERVAAAQAEVAAASQRAEAAQANVNSLISNAEKYLGTPYVWGGKNPSGFDCSGFVQYVFNETYGIDVGGWTGAQEGSGTAISVGEAQAGDLYFWGNQGSTYHVAIATGDGNYIHASQPGTPLEYNKVSNFTPQWALRVNR